MLERRRFTVAHELAHIILDKYHKHLHFEQSQAMFLGHSSSMEKAVDRIAAELLMPDGLVTPLLKDECERERQASSTGVIDKRKVVRQVGKALGVSEWAFVLRLQELASLLAVRLEFVRQSIREGQTTSRMRICHSAHGKLRIVGYPYLDEKLLEREETCEVPVGVSSALGRRTIRCHGWRRPSSAEAKRVQTWVVGWSWYTLPIPKWDDSED